MQLGLLAGRVSRYTALVANFCRGSAIGWPQDQIIPLDGSIGRFCEGYTNGEYLFSDDCAGLKTHQHTAAQLILP